MPPILVGVPEAPMTAIERGRNSFSSDCVDGRVMNPPGAPRAVAHDPEKCERFSDKSMRNIKDVEIGLRRQTTLPTMRACRASGGLTNGASAPPITGCWRLAAESPACGHTL